MAQVLLQNSETTIRSRVLLEQAGNTLHTTSEEGEGCCVMSEQSEGCYVQHELMAAALIAKCITATQAPASTADKKQTHGMMQPA